MLGRSGALLGTTVAGSFVSDAMMENENREGLTLSMTFSNELGQSMAKHTNSKSVSG